jgi:hypothetical protein
MTVNRVCGSGAQAVVSAAQEIMLGMVDCVHDDWLIVLDDMLACRPTCSASGAAVALMLPPLLIEA